jgi:GDPmannose 4,6-dehydratase
MILPKLRGMPQSGRALITGISGQDGSFLAELLLEKGYEVTGMQHSGAASLGASEHLRDRLEIVEGELLEPASLRAAIEAVVPDELYHLAAPTFVPDSWEDPAGTTTAIASATGCVLQTVRQLDPSTRVFVSSSGAIFGEAPETPQNELTRTHPTNPYGIAKLAGHQLVGALREHYGLHASSGIIYNHESERRPEQFVTRRITRAAAAISLGLESEITLGSLDAVRDWSFAGDIMRAAWLMLQQPEGGDYVLGSGVGHTVAELADVAFACVGLEAERHIRVDDALVRKAESTPSIGDTSKAGRELGWEPEVSFEALIERMVRADLRSLEALPSAG